MEELAGNPIEAITGSFEQISCTNYLITGKNDHFTPEVSDSLTMQFLVILWLLKVNSANSGDIVVALIDAVEVTLKRFRVF